MNTFSGLRVIESVYLVEDGEPYTVRRTWHERLFTRPWHPLIATRWVTPKIPYRGAVKIDANTIVMHPATVIALKKQLDTHGNVNGYR